MQNDLKKDKYALSNRSHYDHSIQFYMCSFVYINLETISKEEYFPDARKLFG